MARINYTGGCKVAWETYDNEAEALEASERAKKDADRLAKRGYDFGYQWPGSISYVPDHQEHGECWVVTVP